MVFAADVVQLFLRQRGDAYVYGHEVQFSDPNPEVFDCSEAIEWLCRRLGVLPIMPDGSYNQLLHCRSHGTLRSIAEGIDEQGDLLFMQTGGLHHVALSLGNGSTIEARGRAYGVNVFGAAGRPWSHAARIPGVRYGAPPPGPKQATPPWPGRYFLNPPMTVGEDVARWQRAMNQRRKWALAVDGEYGPASEQACRVLQRNHGLHVDGVVGPVTWRVTFA